MKKFFQTLGLISLIGFSFFYTEKTALVVRDLDDVMIKIKEISDSKKTDPIDAIINGNTIIPGLKGSEIDINKSYNNMKKLNDYNESLLIYKSIKPTVSIVKNYNKYIISGNTTKKQVSLIFIVNDNDNIDKVINILNNYNIKGNFFIDGNWFENNNELIIDLIKNNHTVGNMSYNLDYTNSGFIWMNTIIKKIGKQKISFCYNEIENEEALNICSLQKNYTIRPNIIVDKNPMIEIKQNLTSGSFIALNINDKMINELPLIIEYINSKGYRIVNLETHISEDTN